MYVRGASASEVAAILRLVPFNLVAAGLVLVGGVLGGDAQQAMWAVAGLVWVTPWPDERGGLPDLGGRTSSSARARRDRRARRVGRRHRAGAAGLELDAGLVLAALLSLALSAALWWLYFSDEAEVEQAMHDAPPERRAHLALVGFGYWHYGLLLGVVAVAAGLKKAIGDLYDPLDSWTRLRARRGSGGVHRVRHWVSADASDPAQQVRLAAAAVALATIPLGTELAATAQLAVLVAIVAVAALLRGTFRRLGHRMGQRGVEERSREPAREGIQRTYLALLLGTLAASFIWGINTLFLLDAGLSNLQAFAANSFFTAGMVLFEDIPTGVVADTWGRRTSYLLGTITLASSTFLYYLLW